MKRVLIVLPTLWDRRQLEACRPRWADRYEVVYGSPTDEECPADFDPIRYVEAVADGAVGPLDGVMSSSDYPGTILAALIADRLDLPGAVPADLIRATHKHEVRRVGAAVVPEATPRCWLLDPSDAAAAARTPSFPCFVKPVKGSFSQLARRFENASELEAFLAHPATREYLEGYLDLYNRLVRQLSDLEHDGRWFLAEEVLGGNQVTVEGFVNGGEVHILGVVDSVFHPGTRSFLRFDFPSRLPPPVVARMEEIARTLARALRIDHTLFNVELFHDPASDRLAVIELNPRICGQFGDLYEKVHGVNGYEIALAIACGDRPVYERLGGPSRVASSFPFRVFRTTRVRRAPSPDLVRELEAACPGTLIWVEVAAGSELVCSPWIEDGSSVRYAVVNTGAPSWDALQARFLELERRLAFELEA